MIYPIKNVISIIYSIFITLIVTKLYIMFTESDFFIITSEKIINIICFLTYEAIFALPFVIILIPIIHYIFFLHLNSIFEVTKNGFKSYTIGFRPLGFIRTVRNEKCSRSKVARLFFKQFIDSILISAEHFKNKNIIFQTNTWLISKHHKKTLENLGFKITKINKSKKYKFTTSIISLIAYKRFSIIDEIIDSDFYKITWTHEEVNKLKNYLNK